MFDAKIVFLKEISSQLAEANTACAQLGKEPPDQAALETLEFFFHRIAGSAHHADFSTLGHLAAICESMVIQCKKGTIPTSTVGAGIFLEGIQAVEAVLKRHAENLVAAQKRGDSKDSEMSSISLPIGDDETQFRVMIVDDDAFTTGFIKDCLEKANFLVTICNRSMQALQMIDEERPDLIVLDVLMPEIDGFGLCQRIRQNPGMLLTPIIFLTRKDNLEQRIRGFEVGGNDYMVKPFEPEELVARVRSHLSRLSTLHDMAIRDGLTRCYNQRHFKVRLEQEIARAKRYGYEASLLIIDIDRFKAINDTHGHLVGDMVVSTIAGLINATVRSTDMVSRYGGDEFAVLLIHAGRSEADLLASRIFKRIKDFPFVVDPEKEIKKTIYVTVSLGGAVLRRQDDGVKSFIERADQGLYQAKEAGRDQIRLL